MFRVVGFAGGTVMPPAQERALHECLARWPVAELRHPCRGWSCELAIRAVLDKNPTARVVAHPEDHPAATSPACVLLSTACRPPAFWLTRLRAIVDQSEVLVACPDGREGRRETPWVAVRYARRLRVPCVIIGPDGATTEERTDGRTERDLVDPLDLEPVAGLPAGQ